MTHNSWTGRLLINYHSIVNNHKPLTADRPFMQYCLNSIGRIATKFTNGLTTGDVTMDEYHKIMTAATFRYYNAVTNNRKVVYESDIYKNDCLPALRFTKTTPPQTKNYLYPDYGFTVDAMPHLYALQHIGLNEWTMMIPKKVAPHSEIITAAEKVYYHPTIANTCFGMYDPANVKAATSKVGSYSATAATVNKVQAGGYGLAYVPSMYFIRAYSPSEAFSCHGFGSGDLRFRSVEDVEGSFEAYMMDRSVYTTASKDVSTKLTVGTGKVYK